MTTVARSGTGVEPGAAVAQTAWNWRYFVVRIVAACIVADYTAADHIVAADIVLRVTVFCCLMNHS